MSGERNSDWVSGAQAGGRERMEDMVAGGFHVDADAQGDPRDEGYRADELSPGGAGKQGDQQQMGQAREKRRDKSQQSGGSDKLHDDFFAESNYSD